MRCQVSCGQEEGEEEKRERDRFGLGFDDKKEREDTAAGISSMVVAAATARV